MNYLDNFYVDLVAGENFIERWSNDFSWFEKDNHETYYELYKRVMLAVSGTTEFQLKGNKGHCGFPSRLMLPKGQVGGMTFQLFFIVVPYNKATDYDHTLSCGVGFNPRNLDTFAFGYPFDREINRASLYTTSNMKFYDVKIYHRTE